MNECSLGIAGTIAYRVDRRGFRPRYYCSINHTDSKI